MAIYGHTATPRQDHKWSGVKPDPERKAVDRVCRALRAAREEQGISQQRLAEMAGISRTWLRHIESLSASPTLHSVMKLAKALGITLPDLFREP
jgi:ribosome-binding protein aMBF1 (putative translation factor)